MHSGGQLHTHTHTLQAAREKASERRKNLLYASDRKCVGVASGDSMAIDLEEKISEYAAKRQERIETFVQNIRTKHRLYLEQASPHVSA